MAEVFISYRRYGGEAFAHLLYDRLNAKGYSIFLDVKEQKSGKLDHIILDNIYQCTDFLLILSPGALDRCENTDDWLCLEIESAMKYGKNIVPILMHGFDFPKILPESIRELPNYAGIKANVPEVDRMVSELQMHWLHSNPQKILMKEISSNRVLSNDLNEKMLRKARKDARQNADVYEIVARAEKEDAEAQYMLGRMYYYGSLIIVKNNKKAYYWLRKAAENGHAEAMYYLGKCYFYGFGVERSYALGVVWYRNSVKQDENNPKPLWSLGDCYRKGRGVEKNAVKAADYYLLAAKLNDKIGYRKYVDLILTIQRWEKPYCDQNRKNGKYFRVILLKAIKYCSKEIENWSFFTEKELREQGHTPEHIIEQEKQQYILHKLLTIYKNGWFHILIAMIASAAVYGFEDLTWFWKIDLAAVALENLKTCALIALVPSIPLASGICRLRFDEDVAFGDRLRVWIIIFAILFIQYILGGILRDQMVHFLLCSV